MRLDHYLQIILKDCRLDKWNCDLDKVKMNEQVLSSQILDEGVEPMTFQNSGWNALTTELLGTRGERSHILGSYV